MALKELRVHGRGGQGAVTSTQVLAIAGFLGGKFTQAFPNFGVERAGAPVESYLRVDEKPISIRQHVYEPDYVIVLDAALMKSIDVTAGLKSGGMLIINTDDAGLEKKIRGKFSVKTINVTKIALEIIGKPFVNIASLGAFCALTGEISLDALDRAIDLHFAATGKQAAAELNKKAANAVAEACKK